ncbi:hypothetical protein WJX84_008739 [Apatococcus fuscideae]|uniref:Alpha-taxilin n=1 Tax=Apatococcus fuscideae TaxID=2026836 RepID=A0AAW1T4X1_9CHLO
MSGSAKLQSVDSSDGDVSLYPPNVHSVQRDEAGTANDLACEHETEDQPVDVPAPESPPSHPQKELEAQSKGSPSALDTLHASISALEVQTAEPERKQAAKARKKALRDAQRVVERKDCSSEAKLEELIKMFQLQLTLQAAVENELLPLRKEAEICRRDRDEARSERVRVESINAKLQALARELQKDNKLVHERSQAAFAVEEQKRKTLQDSFQKTAGDISARLDEQLKERTQTLQENNALFGKLQLFEEARNKTEEHCAGQIKAKDLELQLAALKHRQLEAQLQESMARVDSVRGQLQSMQESYGEKFEEFSSTITKSNEVFASFKEQEGQRAELMRTVEKQRRGYEKKLREVTARHQKTDAAILQTSEENAALKQQMQQMQRELQEQSSKSMRAIAQKERMESLARALREEMQQLKAEPQQAPSQPHENGISKSDTFVTSAA